MVCYLVRQLYGGFTDLPPRLYVWHMLCDERHQRPHLLQHCCLCDPHEGCVLHADNPAKAGLMCQIARNLYGEELPRDTPLWHIICQDRMEQPEAAIRCCFCEPHPGCGLTPPHGFKRT